MNQPSTIRLDNLPCPGYAGSPKGGTIAVTLLLALLAAGPAAWPDTDETALLPAEGGTVTRTWMGDRPDDYNTWPDQVTYLYWYSAQPPTSSWAHGWLRFDLSGFPDSTRFDEARLLFNQYHDTLGPACRLTGFAQPGSNAEALYHLVDTSVSVSDSVTPVRGWNSLELNAAGLALLDSCLAGNRVYLGIRHVGGRSSGDIRGLDEPDSLWPRLELTWRTAVKEPGGPSIKRPALRILPNPAPTHARAQLILPRPASGELAILDISGREVWTRRLAGERASTIQLPLLPAGVYLVRLQSPSLTATEKLVVQR